MQELAVVKLAKSLFSKVGEKVAAKKKVWAEQAAISVEENKRREAEFKEDLASVKEKMNVTAIKEEINKGVEAATKKMEEFQTKGATAEDITKKYEEAKKAVSKPVVKDVEAKPTTTKEVAKAPAVKKVQEEVSLKAVTKSVEKEVVVKTETKPALTEKVVTPEKAKKVEAKTTAKQAVKKEETKAPEVKSVAKEVEKKAETKSAPKKTEVKETSTKTTVKKETAKKTPVKSAEKKVATPTKESAKATTKPAPTKKAEGTAAKPATKREEKLALYSADITKHYGKVDEDFLLVVVKNLGPSIYRKDAELVSCSDPKELDTVRTNFLIKKLKMKEIDDVLNSAIKEVCEELKASRNKYRATFYYALAKKFKLESKLR